MTKHPPRHRATLSSSETEITDPGTNQAALCRKIQPYQATKSYLCPGCNLDIGVGFGHFVVVPHSATDLRRHWHETCLAHAISRPATRSHRSKGRAVKRRAKKARKAVSEPEKNLS